MEVGLILLKQISIMFILMLLGFMLFKKGKITKAGSKELGTVLIYCVIPIIIIRTFWVEYTAEKMQSLIYTTVIALITLILAMLIGYIFFKKDGVKQFSVAFSNAGFLGIPLVSAVLGDQAVFYIASLIALLNIFQFTYGVFIMTKNKELISLNKIKTNPILISFVIGLLIFIFKVPNIDLVDSTMSLIAGLNTPLAMIISGVYLAQANLKDLVSSISLYKVSLIRLIIIPLATLGFMLILPNSLYDMKLAILIAASAPTGSNVAIYAQQYDQDYKTSVLIVCLTTLLSIISMPLIIMLASYLFQ